LSVEEFLKAR